jgi:hypothetical protein
VKTALLIAAMALCLVACEEKKSAPPSGTAPTGAAPAAAGTMAAAAGTQMAQAEDLPDESDFDEEAEKAITAANLDAEIDKLEKEIGQ